MKEVKRFGLALTKEVLRDELRDCGPLLTKILLDLGANIHVGVVQNSGTYLLLFTRMGD